MDAQSNNTQPVSDALSDSFVKALNHVTEAAFDADDESLFVAYGATRSILSPAFNAAFAEGNGEVVIAAIEAAARDGLNNLPNPRDLAA